MMRPLPFVFPVGLAFWAVFVWAFFRESRIVSRAMRASETPNSADAGSLQLIAYGQGVAVFAAFWIAFSAPHYRIHAALASYLCGLVVMIAGALMRRHCFRMLGASFTGNVMAHAEQQVIDRGAYRWIRHPSYVAAMLMFAGVGLSLGNWLSVIVFVATCLVVYGYRVHVEERALLKNIGEPYRAYMGRTRRFVPFIY